MSAGSKVRILVIEVRANGKGIAWFDTIGSAQQCVELCKGEMIKKGIKYTYEPVRICVSSIHD